MRSRRAHRLYQPLLAAIVVTGAFFFSGAASAQSDGDERCGKKGTAVMFDALAKSWVTTEKSCVAAGPGAPVNGEKRCGFAGYVLTYEAKRNVWRASQDHCDGSQSYIGWQTIN